MKPLVFAVLFCVAAALLAADVSGSYTTSIEAPDGAHTLVFNLKADGAALTGTVNDGAGTGGRPIQEGKVQGDVVSFSWTTDYQGNPLKLVCKGQVTGSELKMNMGTDDGSWSTELVAKKSR
jgi:hypothetical protein